jgi:hypothetical protein
MMKAIMMMSHVHHDCTQDQIMFEDKDVIGPPSSPEQDSTR